MRHNEALDDAVNPRTMTPAWYAPAARLAHQQALVASQADLRRHPVAGAEAAGEPTDDPAAFDLIEARGRRALPMDLAAASDRIVAAVSA